MAAKGEAAEQQTLSKSQIALARSRTYTLLGRLFLGGLTPETFVYAQAIPQLAEVMPSTLDTDQAAADHQHLFGLNIFPFQSIFLDPTGLLGGPITDGVRRSYRQAGFEPGGSESADHIGHELAMLAFLSGAEADALEDGLPDVASRMVALQADFLREHLLHWLPPLVIAVRQQEDPFYEALANLVLDFVVVHWTEIGDEVPFRLDLAPGPDLLNREDTGLREIADFLLAPPHSGMYLGRDDIGRLARQLSLPRGFGERRQMLLNLLRAAATYEMVGQLLALLVVMVDGWISAYQAIPFAAPWLDRAIKMAGLLAEMGSLLENRD